MTEAELLSLLSQARASNESRGLTGMLLYTRGNFIQGLEGTPEAIEAVITRIRRDNRHVDMRPLLDRLTDGREFGDWCMGFHRLEDGEPISGHVSLRRVVDRLAEPEGPDIMHRILRTYAQTNA
jgi:hypothetical protein